jgi:hypothetical protein
MQLIFPLPSPGTVGTSAVSKEQYIFRVRICNAAFRLPLGAYGGDGKTAGIMVGSHVDKSGIGFQIVYTVRVGTGRAGGNKVMVGHRGAFLLLVPP